MGCFFDNKLKVFFSGIGGVGMSALAKYLKNLSFEVSGSDVNPSATTDELINYGITVYIGHDAANVSGCDVFIYSSAIKEDNVEYCYAEKNGLAILSRAELLSLIQKRYKISIGVCGAHGKTTATALIAHVMHAAKTEFTAFIGGFDKEFSNTCNFGNKYFLAEICEYKRNIDRFSCDVSVFLNVDNDHQECYGGLKGLVRSFKGFYDRSKENIINYDDHFLNSFGDDSFKVSLSCGEVFAKKYYERKGTLCVTVCFKGEKPFKTKTALSGDHNVYNILFAAAVAKKLNISNKYIKKGLRSFKGILRRDEFLGKIKNTAIYADYAHHPKEIKESIKRYEKRFKGKVCYVFQPHTYSRTKLLFGDFVNCFKDLKDVIIYKTYPAREDYDISGDAETLSKSLPNSIYCNNCRDLILLLQRSKRKKGGVVILGAGDLYDQIKSALNKN